MELNTFKKKLVKVGTDLEIGILYVYELYLKGGKWLRHFVSKCYKIFKPLDLIYLTLVYCILSSRF